MKDAKALYFDFETIPDYDRIESLGLVKMPERPTENPYDTTFGIEKEAKYFKMVDVIDEIQLVEKQLKEVNPNFSYRFSLSPFSEYDKRVMGGTGGGAAP